MTKSKQLCAWIFCGNVRLSKTSERISRSDNSLSGRLIDFDPDRFSPDIKIRGSSNFYSETSIILSLFTLTANELPLS